MVFLAGKAHLDDLENSISVLETVAHADGGPFYVLESELAATARMSKGEKNTASIIMVIARNHALCCVTTRIYLRQQRYCRH